MLSLSIIDAFFSVILQYAENLITYKLNANPFECNPLSE